MLPNSEIRQNQRGGLLLFFYIFEDVKSFAIIMNTDIPGIEELYGITICNAQPSASFFWGEHSGWKLYLFRFRI